MRITTFFLFGVFSFLFISCDSTGVSEEDQQTLAAKAKLVEADAAFSIDLFKQIHSNDSSSNIFISPLSVSMALGMTMNGATGNTLTEMQTTLGFSDLSQEEINKGYKSLKNQLENADESIEFDVVNSVWARDGLIMKEEFRDAVQTYFEAETATKDFNDPRTKDEINDWVSEKTNERITQIVDFISPEDVMFLVNAVYFNGNWKNKFDPEKTQEYEFRLNNTDYVTIDMMSQQNEAAYLINEDLAMLELPYGNESFSMLFIRSANPEKSIDDLLTNQLSSESLKEWTSNLTTGQVNYFIPKLELEYKRQMIKDLMGLGMQEVFTNNAELNNLFVEVDNLFVSSILHKTFLKMDEEGTEAAGVTAVTVGVTSLPPPPPSIIFNEPYLIILREKSTGVIAFIGKIGDPSAVGG
ncbi:MAG: serpin family protein [Cyanothece sp. SIO1E1]|nr:serpin family protein [Cyanothece sp. SIO1E1]